MNNPLIRAEDIPRQKLEKLAAPLIRIVAEDLKDPKIRAEFEAWKAKKGAQDAIHRTGGEMLPAN